MQGSPARRAGCRRCIERPLCGAPLSPRRVVMRPGMACRQNTPKGPADALVRVAAEPPSWRAELCRRRQRRGRRTPPVGALFAPREPVTDCPIGRRAGHRLEPAIRHDGRDRRTAAHGRQSVLLHLNLVPFTRPLPAGGRRRRRGGGGDEELGRTACRADCLVGVHLNGLGVDPRGASRGAGVRRVVIHDGCGDGHHHHAVPLPAALHERCPPQRLRRSTR
mmetsp:Transcript_12456/g.39897  ORF Transcript_12456/g.39897 Transcript_12456/m.39897 type:complete len:221 (-) Transcript_12456:46-708(-)